MMEIFYFGKETKNLESQPLEVNPITEFMSEKDKKKLILKMIVLLNFLIFYFLHYFA